MARTKAYSKKTMAPRTKYGLTSSSSSSSSSSQPGSRSGSGSRSGGPSPSSSADANRGRRGRQARASQLTPTMLRAVRRFSRQVGAPNVVEPAGFRDFRGWLSRLGARESRPVWDELIAAVGRELDSDMDAVHAVKEDVVREVVKCVVVPRPDESAKLVSTNAGRQASRPRSGTTLMLVMEQQLERLSYRLPQLVAQTASGGSSSSDDGGAGRRDGALPSVSDILGGRRGGGGQRQSLPSFRELNDSLRRNGSGSGSGSR